jgi:hypothetical protein
MHTLHLSIPIRKPGTNALRLVLAERRGPLNLRCKHKKHHRTTHHGRTSEILLGAPASTGDVVTLEMETDGEAVRVVQVEERSLDPALFPAAGTTPAALAFTATETPMAAIFQWRAGRVGGPFAREQQFFNDMEERTWAPNPHHDVVLALLAEMFARRHADDLAAVTTLEESANAAQLKTFSDLLTGCMRTRFGEPLDHVTEIEDAFDRFARGDLSLLDDTDSIADPAFQEYKARACQPDSAYYVYFAEFASACIRKQVDEALWTELLPALVHTQEAFFEAYRGPGGDPIPLGLPLGGRWRPGEELLTSTADMRRARAKFRTDYDGDPDAVRVNFARQFVEL